MTKRISTLLAAALAVVIIIVASAPSSYAQRDGHDIAVGAGFASIPVLAMGQYELRIGDDASLALRALYGAKTDTGIVGYTGFGIGAAYRFFINNDIPVRGLSVGPAVDIIFYSNSTTNRTARIILLGGEASYKLMLGSISIEPQLSFRIGISGGESISKLTSTLLYPVVLVGYAW
ncbi:MAG TPA: hypothetical protein VEW28_02580 [Candidatus Kapabacteria bacterium]|nr:hypothetical protein [Candidatus Kapabacteria bacterium]